MQTERNDSHLSMLEAIEGFKNAQEANLIDGALEMLMELPKARLSEELLTDMYIFIRSVDTAYNMWTMKKAKKK